MALLYAIVLTGHIIGATRPVDDGSHRGLLAVAKPTIVGGKIVKDGRYPYAAILFDKERGYCSGALIHPQVVLTAAHCTESDYVGVKVGVRNWLLDDIYGREYYGKTIAKAIVHPDFKKNENRFYADMVGDLALLVLSGPLPADAITIRLPNSTTVIPSKLDSVGYGTTSEGGSAMSTELRSVQLDSVARARCNTLLNKLNPKAYNLTDAVVCAGVLAGGRDTCQGDSGGPLFIKGASPKDDVIVGLTSFGEGCARKNAPAGYTNLKKYEKWIKSELNKLVKNSVIKRIET